MQLHKITIESLTEKDKDWFIDVVVANMITQELKRPELLDRGTVAGLVSQSMQCDGVFVARRGPDLLGGLVSVLVHHPFNPKFKILVELAWYILPEYRSSRAGSLLIKAFTKRAEECADESTLSLLASSQVNHSSLSRYGYTPNEIGFLRKHRK